MLDSTPAIATPTRPSISVNPRWLRGAGAAAERDGRRCDGDMCGSFQRSAGGIAGDRARWRARPHAAEDVDDVAHRAAADVAERQRSGRRARAVHRVEDDRSDVAGDGDALGAWHDDALNRKRAVAAGD